MRSQPSINRSRLAWLWAATVVCGLAGGVTAAEPAPADRTGPGAGPAGATTAPDEPAGRLGDLVRLSDRLRKSRWSAPATERFDDPKVPHVFQLGDDSRAFLRDGALTMQGRVFLLRPLHKEVRGAAGIRVDVWLSFEPDPDDPHNKFAVFVGNLIEPIRLVPAFFYDFIHGQGGATQQFVIDGHDHVAKFQPLVPDRPIHACMEILGENVRGQRDGCPALEWKFGRGPRLDERAVVGLTGRCKEARLTMWSVRTLLPGPGDAERARIIQESPFGTAEAVDGFVAGELIPRLDDPAFGVRERTTELLGRLMPAAGPAVRAALKDRASLSPEVADRLGRLVQTPPPLTVEPPVLSEAAAPTTAPDGPQPQPAPGDADRTLPGGVDTH